MLSKTYFVCEIFGYENIFPTICRHYSSPNMKRYGFTYIHNFRKKKEFRNRLRDLSSNFLESAIHILKYHVSLPDLNAPVPSALAYIYGKEILKYQQDYLNVNPNVNKSSIDI